MTTTLTHRLSELRCGNGACQNRPRPHSSRCAACDRQLNRTGAERSPELIEKENRRRERKAGAAPTMAELQKDIDAVLRLEARWTPELHKKLAERMALRDDPDGYTTGSRARLRVAGGGHSSSVEAAVRARASGRGVKDDPQGAALQRIAASWVLIARAHKIAVDAGWPVMPRRGDARRHPRTAGASTRVGRCVVARHHIYGLYEARRQLAARHRRHQGRRQGGSLHRVPDRQDREGDRRKAVASERLSESQNQS